MSLSPGAKSRLLALGVSAFAGVAAADPVPYTSLAPDFGTSPPAREAFRTLEPPRTAAGEALRGALDAAAAGDPTRASALAAALPDPLARKIVDWALVDADGTMLDLGTLRRTAAELPTWPHAARRRAAVEKALDATGPSPADVIAYFASGDPQTPQGAMALASALEAQNRTPEAQALIKKFWRTKIFEAEPQERMRERFGRYLAPEDDRARLDILLYGPQGPATRALLDAAPADLRALAEARIAFRGDRPDAPQLFDLVPDALKTDGGLALDRARYLRKHDLDVIALGLAPLFPTTLPDNPEVQTAVWNDRRVLMNTAIRTGDFKTAYALAAGPGLTQPQERAEAEFFAGWLALRKLKDPEAAAPHFAAVKSLVTSPISVARANYWIGRTAEVRGDAAGAAAAYAAAGAYPTTFYGQLAAEKLGRRTLVLPKDPVPSEADRAAFAASDLTGAVRLLHDAGERDLVRVFALDAAETLSEPAALAELVDLVRGWGDQDLSMRVARAAAQKGVILAERGYPVLEVFPEPGSAEPAFMLSIARQESNFDPAARSGPGARGLMQLMPGTAQIVARRLGVSYSAELLQEPSYNLRLGGAYLGGLVDAFGGSYVLAAAGYNAGPGRPPQWIAFCGDPRGGLSDPVDFIECIPFSETRNYVMRTLETTSVYRARLKGGEAPLTLAEDLKRGAWTPPPAPAPFAPAPGSPYAPAAPSGSFQGPSPAPTPVVAPAAGGASPQPGILGAPAPATVLRAAPAAGAVTPPEAPGPG